VNFLDILMGRASREQEEYEQAQREEWERQRSQAMMNVGELVYLTMRTYAVGGWWNRGNPSALASSLHKLRDAMDMKRLTPDLDT